MKQPISRLALATGAVALIGAAQPASAGLIDFESGFVDKQALGAVVTPDNTVTFSVGGGGTGFIAEVGAPRTAFVNLNEGDDAPEAAAAARIGQFFLTDEDAGPSKKLDYFMVFATAVGALSLDLLDFRADGGPSAGATATLTVFSDSSFTTAIGSDVFTIPSSNPVDGNVETLSVATGGGIKAASVVFSTGDVGTGIDNIRFVPEPATLALLGVGLLGLGALRRRASATLPA